MKNKINKLLSTGLFILLLMLLVQVAIGGITRLTGSGLSITRWDIVTGTLPPLSGDAWQAAFDAYKQSPQYKLLNHGMSLRDFKFIYFWEWLHRLWGRLGFLWLMGMFFYFIFSYKLPPKYKKNFIWLILLYLSQGLLGWIMVKSGLVDKPYVSHYRLTAHLLLALLLIAYVIWFMVQVRITPEQKLYRPDLRNKAWWITALLVVQIIYGGFMAGLKAAGWYATWPLMNGQWLPDNMFDGNLPWWENFSENRATIQFMHRNIAFVLSLLLLWYIRKIWQLKPNPYFAFASRLLLVLLIAQVTLGISTILQCSGDYVPLLWGSLHQLCGLALLSCMLFLNFQYNKQLLIAPKN